MNAYRFAAYPSNYVVAAGVTVLVSVWFLVAAGAILSDPASPYTHREVQRNTHVAVTLRSAGARAARRSSTIVRSGQARRPGIRDHGPALSQGALLARRDLRRAFSFPGAVAARPTPGLRVSSQLLCHNGPAR